MSSAGRSAPGGRAPYPDKTRGNARGSAHGAARSGASSEIDSSRDPLWNSPQQLIDNQVATVTALARVPRRRT